MANQIDTLLRYQNENNKESVQSNLNDARKIKDSLKAVNDFMEATTTISATVPNESETNKIKATTLEVQKKLGDLSNLSFTKGNIGYAATAVTFLGLACIVGGVLMAIPTGGISLALLIPGIAAIFTGGALTVTKIAHDMPANAVKEMRDTVGLMATVTEPSSKKSP